MHVDSNRLSQPSLEPIIETTGKVVKKLFPQKSNLMLPQEPQARHRLWEKVTLLVILTEKGFNIPHYPKQLKRY